MGRFARSWEIAKASGRVLSSDKELAVLPVLGFVASMAVLGLTGAAVWFSLHETIDLATGATTYEPSGVTYAVGFVGYVLTTFVGIFFTAALVAGAHQRLTGADPSIATALEAAGRRIGPIFGWAVVATTVGMILQAIRDRGLIGRVVAGFLDLAWQVLTFLAIPVIIVEGTGPFASLKRCTALFRQTWGENLVAQVGFGLVGFLAILPGLALGAGLGSVAPIAGIVLAAIWIGAVAIVLSSLNGIFRAALYIYATTGQSPEGFPAATLTGAFTSKRGASLLR